MNYRERQLRHILKQEQAKWSQQKDILQQDLVNLENSIDAQILAQEREKNENLQKALDSLVEVLGKEDIHNLADLKALLHGQTLKGLLALFQQKHNDLETQLINLAKQKISKQKQASELLNHLESHWKNDQSEWAEKELTYQTQIQAKNEELTEQKDQNQQLSAEQATLKEELAFYADNLKTKEEIIRDYQKENKELTETNQAQTLKITNLTAWSEGQHNQISELESSEKTLTQEKQNLIQQVQEDRATYQRAKSQLKEAHQKELNEQKTFYSRKIKDLTSQLTTEKQTNSNLESQLHSQQEQNNLLKETNQTRQETIQTKNNRITQLENYLNESQKDQQTKQTLINSLQQEKINLQTKITHLTNQTTVQVSKLADQLTQINTQQADLLQKEAKLAKHKNKKALTKEEIKTLTENITNYQAKERDLTERIRVLEEKETRQRGALTQLLANRENELREMEENNG